MLVFGLASLESCRKDTFVEKVNSIQIISGKTEIAASGGTNEIVTSIDGITASAEDQWLDVTVKENVITVSADINSSRESRHTIVTISAANGDFLDIPVSQLGAVYVIEAPAQVLLNNGRQNLSYGFTTNLEVKISTSADWLEASLENGELTINIEENSGSLRAGKVIYEVGDFSDYIIVVQAEFDRDIAGQYFIFGGLDLDYPDDSDSEYFTTLAQVVKSDEDASYSLDFPMLGWSLPVTVNTDEMTITLPNGGYAGTYSRYYIYGCIGDYGSGGYITSLTTASMTASFVYDEEAGGLYADIEDNGSWSNYNADSYSFYAYSAQSFSNSYRVGYLVWVIYPFLMSYSPDAAGIQAAAVNPALPGGTLIGQKMAGKSRPAHNPLNLERLTE